MVLRIVFGRSRKKNDSVGTFAVATALLMTTWRVCVEKMGLQWWDIVLGQSTPVTKLLSAGGGSESLQL